jgi:cytochrome c-type biogenesis protein CcmE
VHPVRKQRLTIVLFIVAFSSLAVGLVTYGLRGNINLFFPPAEIAAGNAPTGQSIRMGGMVVAGSVVRASDSLKVRFDVTDYQATVTAEYEGILPDLFAEGEGVVAAGVLDESGVFQATEVLAKHDENYMPPEVADALASSAEKGKTESGKAEYGKTEYGKTEPGY